MEQHKLSSHRPNDSRHCFHILPHLGYNTPQREHHNRGRSAQLESMVQQIPGSLPTGDILLAPVIGTPTAITEPVNRHAYPGFSSLTHWLRREREPFPLLQLPRQACSLVYKHALSSHTGVRIVDGEVQSAPHPLLLSSWQVNQEVWKIKDDCALNISCELTALGQAKKFLARYDRLYPRQRQRLRLRVFPSGLSWTHAEHCDVWAAAWEAAFDTPAFQGIDIDLLPKLSLRAIWEWMRGITYIHSLRCFVHSWKQCQRYSTCCSVR